MWFKKYGISADFLQLAPGYPGQKDQKKAKVDQSKAFDEEDDSEPIKIDKSNILLLGPTGSGKEHLTWMNYVYTRTKSYHYLWFDKLFFRRNWI